MKITRYLSAIIVGAGLLTGSRAAAASSELSVTASLDSTVVVMGDVTHMRVDVTMPQALATSARLIDFPELTPGMEYLPWNGVDIVAADSVSRRTDGRLTLSFDYTVQAFDPGTLTFPPFSVLAAEGGDTVRSNVVTVKVLPVDVDSLETIHPMVSIVSPDSRWYDFIPNWLLWVLLGVAVVAGGVAAYFFLRKHHATIELRRNPPVPPYEMAMSRLNTLRSRNLPENGHEKEYYTELVDILRQYLHGRFGINAMEMTSTQIVRALRANPETKMTAEQMRSVLAIADFVKFAKVRPLPDDNARSFSRAVDFVEQTKPQPEPEAEGGEAAAAQQTTNRQ